MTQEMLADGFHDIPNDRIAAVVTSLEMFARPAERPAPVGPWSLRHLERPEPGDYRALYRKIGERWVWFSRIVMDDNDLAAIVQHPKVEVYGLETEEELQGLLELDFRVDGEAELAFFGVGPSLIGGGAARWLMNRALDLAWQRPISRFWVHTCTMDHPNALGFYRRSGFMPFRRQIEVAPDPRLRGISMASRDHVPVLA